ncbi:phosphatidylserine decarboxylase [Plasmodiophora brassicae]|uniref:phosphatidylserine decarboxylase n=1 Tax=Plasmodiophora brassicae TaxID=37360 RepID=A0A0G4J130_PLABS|nr:hypothetical protein PBRA_008333 [Plasmodiophora brassicae]SPQ95269.1 unnamed protein product [Plasmodiophora brassicae]
MFRLWKVIRARHLLGAAGGSAIAYSAWNTPPVPPSLAEPATPVQSTIRWAARALPHRATSRMYGLMAGWHIPEFLRSPIFGAWAFFFNADLDEARYPPRAYTTLNDFFTRPLKDGIRPIDAVADVVSPADGLVTICGQVSPHGRLDQIKDSSYALDGFLGCAPEPGPGSSLYYCVVYLAPGDYHRFHSPSRWHICERMHIAGDLLSVAPALVRRVPGLFTMNERVSLIGQWAHGFYSLTAVGAFNVGSIRINMDDDLVTNLHGSQVGMPPLRRPFMHLSERGDELGRFMLGSTLVVVWEAPDKQFEFTVQPGQVVRVGQSIGSVTL